jgi:hypothetical protein
LLGRFTLPGRCRDGDGSGVNSGPAGPRQHNGEG